MPELVRVCRRASGRSRSSEGSPGGRARVALLRAMVTGPSGSASVELWVPTVLGMHSPGSCRAGHRSPTGGFSPRAGVLPAEPHAHLPPRTRSASRRGGHLDLRRVHAERTGPTCSRSPIASHRPPDPRGPMRRRRGNRRRRCRPGGTPRSCRARRRSAMRPTPRPNVTVRTRSRAGTAVRCPHGGRSRARVRLDLDHGGRDREARLEAVAIPELLRGRRPDPVPHRPRDVWVPADARATTRGSSDGSGRSEDRRPDGAARAEA